MQITEQDREVGVRKPTVSRNTSLGREFYRTCTWTEGETTVTVTAIAFVSGLRARKNPDGSTDLLEAVNKFSMISTDEFIQPVERAMFIWDRQRPGPDGGMVAEQEIDYSNEVGKGYVQTLELAEGQCERFIAHLDFAEMFDPGAWE